MNFIEKCFWLWCNICGRYRVLHLAFGMWCSTGFASLAKQFPGLDCARTQSTGWNLPLLLPLLFAVALVERKEQDMEVYFLCCVWYRMKHVLLLSSQRQTILFMFCHLLTMCYSDTLQITLKLLSHHFHRQARVLLYRMWTDVFEIIQLSITPNTMNNIGYKC